MEAGIGIRDGGQGRVMGSKSGFKKEVEVGFWNKGGVSRLVSGRVLEQGSGGFRDVGRGQVSRLGLGFDFRMEVRVVIRDGRRVQVMG